jgi:CBS domain containing-hemolysin-like protein
MSVCVCVGLCCCLSLYDSVSVSVSVYMCMCVSLCLSVCLSVCFCPNIYASVNLQKVTVVTSVYLRFLQKLFYCCYILLFTVVIKLRYFYGSYNINYCCYIHTSTYV